MILQQEPFGRQKINNYLFIIKYYLTENISMRSKQDELLEKLQKCVGKIDGGRPSTTERHSYREPVACFDQNMYAKVGRDKKVNYDICYQHYQEKPTIPAENRRAKRMDQQNIYPGQSSYQMKSGRNSLTKNYLTERKYLQNIQEPKQSNREAQQKISRLYQKQRKSVNESARKTNNIQGERLRRPLRDYQVNQDSNNLNSSFQLDMKETRSYLHKLNENSKKYEVSNTPKYEERRGAEVDRNQTPTYRRNSISYNESYKKQQNRSINQIKPQQTTTNYQYNCQAADYTKERKQGTNSYNQNSYNKSNHKNYQLQSVEELNHSKQLNSQSKLRPFGAGSISSVIKKNSLQISKANYETFQPKDQKDLNIQRILDQVGSANQDTYSKLQKISELNDRINMRIKNIIQTFEAK